MRATYFLGPLLLLALPALGANSLAQTPALALPHSAVPGGIARLALGPSPTPPAVTLHDGAQDVPVLVLGDAIEIVTLPDGRVYVNSKLVEPAALTKKFVFKDPVVLTTF